MKNTDISERISQLLINQEVSKNEFAKKLGYNRSQSIYDIINGKAKPSYDFFQKLYNSEYSEIINPIWLLTGKGNMLLEEPEQTNHQTNVFKLKTDQSQENQEIPLYNIEAAAGLVELFQSSSSHVPIDTLRITQSAKM